MKNLTITLDENDLRTAEKTARRNEMIELGIYNLHKNRVFKSKKNYTRKMKYKIQY